MIIVLDSIVYYINREIYCFLSITIIFNRSYIEFSLQRFFSSILSYDIRDGVHIPYVSMIMMMMMIMMLMIMMLIIMIIIIIIIIIINRV